MRHRFKQTVPLAQRLAKSAQRLRQQAGASPPGLERELLLGKAQQAEEAIACAYGEAMSIPTYYAYIIGADGHFRGRVAVSGRDDEEASRQAKQLAENHPAELWQGARMVATFEPQRETELDSPALSTMTASDFRDDAST